MKECISHPGKRLIDHLKGVREIGLSVFKDNSPLFSIPSKDIQVILEKILLYHDFAKATTYFQDYIHAKIKGNNVCFSSDQKNHALLSALYAAAIVYKDFSSPFYSILVFSVILKHHGDLENLKDMLFISDQRLKKLHEQYTNIWWNELSVSEFPRLAWSEIENIVLEMCYWIEELEFKKEYFFVLKYLYSVLLYSDKNEAIFSQKIEMKSLPAGYLNWIQNYKLKKFEMEPKDGLNRQRERIFEIATNRVKNLEDGNIFFLNVPTGMGKTLTGLQCALEFLNKYSNLNKIIYAVPFTSIIDQIEEGIKEILCFNGISPDQYYVKHHHLVEPKIRIDEDVWEGERGQFLIENWDHPIVLTTFWQIFHTIFYGDNKLNRKFHNLCNSVIILDEIQTVPLQYWKIVKEVLKILTECMNCKIIYMTATLPLIFTKEETMKRHLILEEELQEVRHYNRYSLRIVNNLQPIKIENLISMVRNRVEKRKEKILIVLNTIRASIEVYEQLKEKIGMPLMYLSTNIIPLDRINRIMQIKRSQSPLIVVSTQLIEAGVDLDFDVVYRDIAPFDSIVQSAGRCNRNMKTKGEVYVFTLLDENQNRKFASYVYSSISLSPTIEILKNKSNIAENTLYAILQEYYEKVHKRQSSNVESIISKNILNMEFSELLKNFHLISNSPEQLVFVEKDERASSLLDEFLQIRKNYFGFERRNKFLEIKNKFFNYVLSIRISKENISFLKSFEEAGNFLVLSKEMVKQFYKETTGLYLDFDNFI